MTCRPITDDAGHVIGVACTRGSRGPKARCACGNHCSLLCDWKLKGPKAGKTCDGKLCERCAQSPAPEKHLCPAHWRMWQARCASASANATKGQP